MIFIAKNAFTLQWTLKDNEDNPINNATVTATLYVGRSPVDPNGVPGIPVDPVNNVSLVYVAASNGVYQAAIPATLDPGVTDQNYVLVIDASIASVPVYHKEEPSVVLPYPIDLTTLDAVKSYLKISPDNVNDDQKIQDAITMFSQWVLTFTGVDSFTRVVQYTELRDGNGNNQIFPRNRPIRSVISFTANGIAVPAAGAYPSWGYFISDDLKSIKVRATANPGGFNYFPTYGFGFVANGVGIPRGIGNVQIVYTAGYPYVPFDLEFRARQAVAINYKRRETIDLASRAIATGGTTGTTRFRDWALPPEVCEVLEFYQRQAII